MPQLRLYLLGTARLEADGVSVKIDRHKATALIAYLTITGKPHHRNELATLLWPEYDQSRGRAALRRTLMSLKMPGDWIEADYHTIGLKPEADVWVDAIQFRQKVSECPQEMAETCIAPLTEAVNLYQGDFLAGFTLRDCPTFDEWQFFETDSFRNEYAGALDNLAQAYAQKRDYKTAITYARKRLTLDPLYEPAHRALIQIYAQDGQWAAALKQYRECVRTFEEELGVPLQDETIKLYESIRANQIPGEGRAEIRKTSTSELTLPTAQPATPDRETIELSSGLSLERLSSGQLLAYTFRDVSQASVDLWAETTLDALRAWTANHPYFLMTDFSDKKWGPTPYSRERAQEILNCRPDLRGYYAIVMPHNSFAGHMMQLFLRGQAYPNISIRSFFNREAGLGWLQKMANGRQQP
jgi:DNA-binding SARP family transcriptional activator